MGTTWGGAEDGEDETEDVTVRTNGCRCRWVKGQLALTKDNKVLLNNETTWMKPIHKVEEEELEAILAGIFRIFSGMKQWCRF